MNEAFTLEQLIAVGVTAMLVGSAVGAAIVAWMDSPKGVAE